jgi:hypothetical protein
VCCTAATERRPGQRWEEEDGATAGPIAGACADRWVDAPSSSGSSEGPTRGLPHGAATVVGLLPVAAMTSRAPTVVAVPECAAASGGSESARNGEQRHLTAHHLTEGASEWWIDGVTFYPSDTWIQQGPTVVVTRNNMKGESPETLIPSIRLSPSIFFYPNSDLCPSPAQLIPMIEQVLLGADLAGGNLEQN